MPRAISDFTKPVSAYIRSRSARWMVLIALVGIATRVVVAYFSFGSNDALIWFDFGAYINQNGLYAAYKNLAIPHKIVIFNHPPLMGWLASGIYELKNERHDFIFLFKQAFILADLISAIILFRIISPDKRKPGALVAMFFAWNPVSIMVTGYHGNTDSLCAMFCLLAAFCYSRRAFFYAGLAIGAALNIKLIPLFIVPAFFLSISSFKDVRNYSLGLAIALIPFLFPLVNCYDAFMTNVVHYNSNTAMWGTSFLLYQFKVSPYFASWGNAMSDWYVPNVRYLMLAGGIGIGLIARRFKIWTAYEIASLPLAMFLLLTPGFGVQYSVYIVPVLYAVSLKWSMRYFVPTGLMLFGVYSHYWTETWPAFSAFRAPLPGVCVVFGFIGWLALGRYIWSRFTLLHQGKPYQGAP